MGKLRLYLMFRSIVCRCSKLLFDSHENSFDAVTVHLRRPQQWLSLRIPSYKNKQSAENAESSLLKAICFRGHNKSGRKNDQAQLFSSALCLHQQLSFSLSDKASGSKQSEDGMC